MSTIRVAIIDVGNRADLLDQGAQCQPTAQRGAPAQRAAADAPSITVVA